MRNAIADIRVRHMCVSTRRGHAVADVAASLTSSPSSATAQRYMVICLVTRSALIASTIYLMNSTNVQPNFASLLPGSDNPRISNMHRALSWRTIAWRPAAIARMYHPVHTNLYYTVWYHAHAHTHTHTNQMPFRCPPPFRSTVCHVRKCAARWCVPMDADLSVPRRHHYPHKTPSTIYELYTCTYVCANTAQNVVDRQCRRRRG